MISLKEDCQFYWDVRTFSWLYWTEACNDVMNCLRLERLIFISFYKSLKKIAVKIHNVNPCLISMFFNNRLRLVPGHQAV